MLIGGIVAAVVVLGLAAVLLTRRMGRNDAHSVEGYHRSIHTLESINAHPAVPSAVAESGPGTKSSFPESAIRLAGSASVRVTDAKPAVPPVPPPPVTNLDAPVTFDDAGPPPPPMVHEPVGNRDKAMGSINHRPRRLAAPATAVAGVIILVVVLLLTGSHTVAPQTHHHGGSSSTNATRPKSNPGPTVTNTTSTTAPQIAVPQVAVPQSSAAGSATYTVAGTNFTLAFSATTGLCWVDVTSATTGATVFEQTLLAGERHVLAVSGPVSVVIGAPTVLGVMVNGSAVALPSGFHTPFTMHFVTAA
jgi:Domain of unknown function (DUF4115)